MSQNSCAVILAAGMGKRMKSELPKVMCEVLGKPMLDYVIAACKASVNDICVVVGYKADIIKAHLGSGYNFVLQTQQLGTGHAVMQASDFIKAHTGSNVLILCGDAPLMNKETIESALTKHIAENNAITVITAELDDPASYGRIVKQDGKIKAIVEYKDATDEIRQLKEINSGAFWFNADVLLEMLTKIDNNNAQNEYYLTDTIKIAIELEYSVGFYLSSRADVVMGANDPEQLQELNNRAKLYF